MSINRSCLLNISVLGWRKGFKISVNFLQSAGKTAYARRECAALGGKIVARRTTLSSQKDPPLLNQYIVWTPEHNFLHIPAFKKY